MQTISSLKNKHKGKDIWVIASGKSADYIDTSFFDNKITIGVNQVPLKFKNITYHLMKESGVAIECQDKWHIDVVSKYDCGDIYSVENPVRHYFFNHRQNEHTTFDEELDTDDSLIVSWSTITSAIHFAYFMGAKNIILLGHDCGILDGYKHLTGYKEGEAYLDNWLSKIEPQTLRLKELLKEKEVNLYSLNPFINFGLEGHIYTR